MNKLLVVMCFSLASTSAATINLCSDLVNEGNNLAAANVFIQANPAWAQPGACGQWVSFDDTGDGGTLSPANSIVTGAPTAIFSETFNLGTNRTAKIKIWADDTARVRLVNSVYTGSGQTLIDAFSGGFDLACSAGGIGCETHEGVELILDQYLAQGVNTLYIEAYQRWGGPFGVMYTGQANSNFVPEPASYLLLGTGLAGFWFVRRRRGA